MTTLLDAKLTAGYLSIASARPNHVGDGESAGDPYADHHDGRDDEEAAGRSGVLHDVPAYDESPTAVVDLDQPACRLPPVEARWAQSVPRRFCSTAASFPTTMAVGAVSAVVLRTGIIGLSALHDSVIIALPDPTASGSDLNRPRWKGLP
jgi:hypothetical protein